MWDHHSCGTCCKHLPPLSGLVLLHPKGLRPLGHLERSQWIVDPSSSSPASGFSPRSQRDEIAAVPHRSKGSQVARPRKQGCAILVREAHLHKSTTWMPSFPYGSLQIEDGALLDVV